MSSVPSEYIDDLQRIVLSTLNRVEQLRMRVLFGVDIIKGSYGQELQFKSDGKVYIDDVEVETDGGIDNFNIVSYGAVPNNSSEASGALNVTAFNDAIAAARAVDGYVYIPTGTWYVADNIIWTHHKDAGPVKIRGAGVEKTIIKPTAAMVASDKNIFYVLGSVNPGTYQYISYFEFENFSIIGSGYTGTSNACGIAIGKAAIGAVDYAVDSFKKMPIKNVFIENMRYGIQIFSSRQIQMDRVVIRTDVANNKCLYIYCHDGSFTGDIVGYNCEFVSDAAGTGEPIGIATNGSGSEVRGIHFTDCTMYFGNIGTHIYATALGVTNDIWFTSCAWDGPYGPTVFSDAIQINNVGGFIRGVQISNPYIVNWDNCIIATCTGNYDTLSNININGGYIGYCTGYGINIYQGMGYTIHGITFYDVDNTTSGAGVINFGNVPSTGYRDGCAHISITGNTHVSTDLNPDIDHFIHLGTGITNYAISNNTCIASLRCIQDESNDPSGRKVNNMGGSGSGISNWDTLRIGQGDYTTISSGTFARVSSRHELHPETGAADILNTVTLGLSGDLLVMCGGGNSDQITITNKYGSGAQNSFITSNDTDVILDWYDVILFMFNGWNWVELGRSLSVTDEELTRTTLSQLTTDPTFNSRKITGIAAGIAAGQAIEYSQFAGHVGNANAHHAQSHNIASHSDTSVTGAQLTSDHSKLSGIEPAATADQSDSEIITAIVGGSIHPVGVYADVIRCEDAAGLAFGNSAGNAKFAFGNGATDDVIYYRHISPSADNTWKIGYDGGRFSDVWMTNSHVGDLCFSEKVCETCGKPFEVGERLELIVIASDDDDTHTVPVHRKCNKGD